MKKHLVIILLAVFSAHGAQAQKALDWSKIEVSNLSVEEQNGVVNIAFNVATAKAAKKKQVCLLTPVLTDGYNRAALPPVVVEGKNAWNGQWLAELVPNNQGTLWIGNKETGTYRASMPIQEWMSRADLVLEGATANARDRKEAESTLLAAGLRLQAQPQYGYYSQEKPQLPENFSLDKYLPFIEVPMTKAELLAERHGFLAPLPKDGQFDNPFDIYHNAHESTVNIFFHAGSHHIDPDFHDNIKLLEEITSVINEILASRDSEIAKIVLAGFASPEGSFDSNSQLAYNRAIAVKEHILQTTNVPYYRMPIYNGEVDWEGLKRMVEGSDLKAKAAVIGIINDYESPETRLARLQQLNGGSTYYYLLREYFPALRTGTLVQLYYKNKERK